ncbi:MAG TPA: hypothetical protein VFQ60_01300 [Patescibacteria group bacterium]|nr:hypothetical protein [Patescibacteria group bacterium]
MSTKKVLIMTITLVVLAVLIFFIANLQKPKSTDTGNSAAAGSTLPAGEDNGLSAGENAAR